MKGFYFIHRIAGNNGVQDLKGIGGERNETWMIMRRVKYGGYKLQVLQRMDCCEEVFNFKVFQNMWYLHDSEQVQVCRWESEEIGMWRNQRKSQKYCEKEKEI